MPASRRRRPQAAALAVAVLGLTAALTACSAAEDAVTQATEDAKSQASSAAAGAAADVVRGQICRLVSDGTVTEDDVRRLRELADQAEQAGVPQEVLRPARELVDQGADATGDQVTKLREACSTA
jgi:CO dehydrogenase/acetyl-CoA synthase gamma subunit (corrinoid Fe-S protein)